MTSRERTADRLFQVAVVALSPHCHYCGDRATVAHHIIPRRYWSVRHDIGNGLAVCHTCHSDIHAGRLGVEISTELRDRARVRYERRQLETDMARLRSICREAGI